jgi:hypothetical protein
VPCMGSSLERMVVSISRYYLPKDVTPTSL